MFILKLAGKILLLPVWLILFVIGLAVKMTVQTYAVVRGILGFIFTLLIIATAYCYHDWVQVAFMWEYLKVSENSREKVKNLLKDANENRVKLSHQAPTLYDVVPKEEIAEFEELMRKTIADIVSEASSVACWVYVQKYVKQKTLDEMLQELPGAGQFIIVMDTWFERLMAE